MTGFGAHFESEAVAGALPKGRNSPQRPAFGLYTEQLSGSSFTSPRHENRRSWLYRMRPTADHRPFVRYEGAPLFAGARRATRARTGCAEIRCKTCPGEGLRRWHGDHAHQSGAARSRGRRGSPLPRPQEHGSAGVCRFGWRTTDHSSGRRAEDCHRVRPHRRRGRAPCGDPSGRKIPRRGRTAKAAAMSPKSRPPVCGFPSLARSALTASPIPAISKRRSPGSKTRTSRPK